MSQPKSSQARIAELQAEIATLRKGAITELQQKRTSLEKQIAEIDVEIAKLTGNASESKKRGPAKAGPGKSIPLSELKDLLAAAPNKTLSIRQAKLDLANIKTLANANPHLLKIGGKGPWPTVTLLK